MHIWNVKISPLTRLEALDKIKSKQIIFTPNPEILLKARREPKYLRALNKGTLMLPDGHGLQLVSTLLRFPRFIRIVLLPLLLPLFLLSKKTFKRYIPEVIHGSDFMADLIAWSASNDKKVFFLGGGPDVAKKCSDFFLSKHPHLKVAGTSALNPNNEAVKEVLNAKPDVLFVAYGAPKQELWIAKHADKLKNVQLIMGVGGSFDFWSGEIKRAPKFMRSLGLEWLWRLMIHPKQRFGRILNALVVFPVISSFSSPSSFQLSE